MNKDTHTIICSPHRNLAEGKDQRKQPQLQFFRLKRDPHPRVYTCKWFFHTQLLDGQSQGLLAFSVWGELIYNRRPWGIFSSCPTSTHIWERITTVSSWNATAVASPISRPRRTAAKKVTTHITCNEQGDGSSYKRVKDMGREPKAGAAMSGLFFQMWSRLSTHL